VSGTDPARAVLVTGAAGFIGRRLIGELSADRGGIETLVAVDVREVPTDQRRPGVEYVVRDVRDPTLEDVLRQHGIEAVVHLAAIVTPGRDTTPEEEYAVDVLGTENVLRACEKTGVRQIIVTSSGAAYGYHADSPRPLHEDDPLRGNDEFAYSRHKRLVEEMLAIHRESNPNLHQLIFRPGAILGEAVKNQISEMFERPVVLGVTGSDIPFVLIWDEDVARAITRGLREGRQGIYNLTGDGAITLREMAQRMGKPYLPLPAAMIRGALRLLRLVGATRLGPEQVNFLRYRPVLANDRLKREFGFTPSLSSAEVFDRYRQSRERAG
jgi:UDP-glucose 4-epimerase